MSPARFIVWLLTTWALSLLSMGALVAFIVGLAVIVLKLRQVLG